MRFLILIHTWHRTKGNFILALLKTFTGIIEVLYQQSIYLYK